jgi:hypothetical protein
LLALLHGLVLQVALAALQGIDVAGRHHAALGLAQLFQAFNRNPLL